MLELASSRCRAAISEPGRTRPHHVRFECADQTIPTAYTVKPSHIASLTTKAFFRKCQMPFRGEQNRQRHALRSAAKLLTKDEARRITANIAKQSPRCFSAPRCINGPPPLSARTAPSAPSVGHAVSALHRPTRRAVIPSPSVTVAGVRWWGSKAVVRRPWVIILRLGRYECAKGDCANAASG